jgi:hypothetical protein
MKINYCSVKKLIRLFLIIAILPLFIQTNSYAQSSQGTEFWICFPGNIDMGGTRQLYITAQAGTNVTVNAPAIGYSSSIFIPAGTLSTFDLSTAIDVVSNGTIDTKSIHVTADNPVTVYGMNQHVATTDAYLALPVDALGTDYAVMGYTRDYANALLSQMTIVATQDNTTVTITPTATGGGFTAGVTGNVVLNTGDVFQLRSNVFLSDYTGSRVVSDKPVSVFGGNDCTNISGGLRACDHLVEQITPTTSWGKNFLTVPLATRLAGDVFRIMAQQSGTNVSINGVVVATLNAWEFYETILASNTYNRITSDNPILVGQFCRSSQADNVTSDPFFTLIPPDEQFLNSYIVSAGTSNIPINYLNITSPNSNTGSVLVDGSALPGGLWNTISGTSFSGAQVPVNTGVHTVSSPLPIGLLVYGFGSFDSYGYLGGQAFGAVATASSLTISPVNGTGKVNSNRCWNAELLDQFGAPVTGVRVDFNITGPNSASSGFAFTNASGIATFCYTGTLIGQDVIIASVGSLNATAQFNWTPDAVVPISNWALYLGIFLAMTFVIIRFRKMI